MIEDLISTGDLQSQQLKPLKQAGAEVLGVVAIFTYGLKKADDTFSNIQLPFYTFK